MFNESYDVELKIDDLFDKKSDAGIIKSFDSVGINCTNDINRQNLLTVLTTKGIGRKKRMKIWNYLTVVIPETINEFDIKSLESLDGIELSDFLIGEGTVIFMWNKLVSTDSNLERCRKELSTFIKNYKPELVGYLEAFASQRFPIEHISRLTDKNRVKVSTGKKSKRKFDFFSIRSFEELLVTQFPHSDWVIERLHGYTYNQIAKEHKLTRSRIQNVVSVDVGKMPDFPEIEWAERLLGQFRIDKTDFEKYFGGSGPLFEYIRLKNGKGKEENIDEYILNSSRYTHSEKMIYAGQHSLFEETPGVYKKLNLTNIRVAVLKNNPDVVFDDQKLIDYSNNFVFSKLLPYKYITHGRIAQSRQFPIIRSLHGKYRYYDDTQSIEYFDELESIFDVGRGLYGIEYFFESDMALMKKINIKSGPELANLISQIGLDSFPQIVDVFRMSQVLIGFPSKDEFYLHCIKSFDGEKFDSLIDYLTDELKLNGPSQRSYFQTQMRQYFKDDVVVAHSEMPKDMLVIQALKAGLNAEFYTREEFEQRVTDISPGVDVSPGLLQELGYTTHGSLITQKKYGSMKSSIIGYADHRDFVDIDEIKRHRSHGVEVIWASLELDHKIIRVSESKYASIRTFEKNGVTINEFIRFLNHVVNFIDFNAYFSWPSLLAAGFSDELIDLDFEEIFYERLISTDTRIKTIQTNRPIFIKPNETDDINNSGIRLSEFLSTMIPKGGIEIYQLSEELKNQYNLILSEQKILDKVNADATLEYSPILEKVYLCKTDMLDDVYSRKE